MEKTAFPNPVRARMATQLLDGIWSFGYDNEKWQDSCVPYCPESELSGVRNTDFIPVCYYKRTFTPQEKGKRVLLNFGAVDYFSQVFVNGKFAGEHKGGYTPFCFDITDLLREGENELSLCVRDYNLTDQPRGKQSFKKQSFGCFYTRTTGIWQSVWLEYAPENRIDKFYFYPDIDRGAVNVDLFVKGKGNYRAEVSFGGKIVGISEGRAEYRKKFRIGLDEKHLWDLGKGNLYDVRIVYEGDEVFSYFGLREVGYEGMEFVLNKRAVFQKLVLDQGYYPDGIYTAPDLATMQKDIDIALDLGFNGARLHQKVFDPKFLYLCDKAGYMVWGEFPGWGVDYHDLAGVGQFLNEWEEALSRDFNHPCIVTWCPLNEAWGAWDDAKKKRDVRYIDIVYNFTKIYDVTRPCVDVSGGHHGHKTDLYDFHCYESTDNLRKYLALLDDKDVLEVPLLYCKGERLRYKKGIPVNISEFGGIALGVKTDETNTVNEGAVQSEETWGYGKGEQDGGAFVKRYEELAKLLFSCKKLSGFCYTQLYDVEQEQNGFYDYHRNDKLTAEQKRAIRKINGLRS